MKPRRLQFTVRLTAEELARLRVVARHHGTTLSDVWRLILKLEERRLRAAGQLGPGR